MKIAFISYEYPPDTAYGGIATYVYQIARILHRRGHYVEVFTASHQRASTIIEDGIIVHRILESTPFDRRDFANRVGQVFVERHELVKFDVLEGAEADAHTRVAVQNVPDIPLVIKLHTPTFMVTKLNYVVPSFQLKARRVIGALRRGEKPTRFPRYSYDPSTDIERLHTLEADEITSPSSELAELLIEAWKLPLDKVVHLPNPYTPTQAMLDIPVATYTNVVGFVGRLEARKGILELIQAIPAILRKKPETKFLFIGKSHDSPTHNLTMQQYIERKFRQHRKSLEFTGAVPLEQIPSLLASADICVFPSRWENFPNVCLEAMSAARGVVASCAGGMTDMLDQGRAGRLVPPFNPTRIAQAVLELSDQPEIRMQLGKSARDRVLAEYNAERIGSSQEESYRRAIIRRQIEGQRAKSLNIAFN